MNTINNLIFLLLSPFLFVFSLPGDHHKPNRNIAFKSTDGGQTWQDISEGLPEYLQTDGLRIDDFFTDGSGLHLFAKGNGIYHSKPNSMFWKKENYKQGCIPRGKGWMLVYNNDSTFSQKTKGTGTCMNFQQKDVNTVFETAGGAIVIGANNGVFKSTNGGKIWKKVYSEGGVSKIAGANGVLLATSQKGILRSTDEGENWDYVISEGGLGIAVEHIKGGFAAITYNTASKTRRMRTSYDGGKTWQSIDDSLPANLSITSIIQVGEYFFCGHPTGIYRSSDKGKTWQLLRPSVKNKVFNLSVSGNAIYAIPVIAGC